MRGDTLARFSRGLGENLTGNREGVPILLAYIDVDFCESLNSLVNGGTLLAWIKPEGTPEVNSIIRKDCAYNLFLLNGRVKGEFFLAEGERSARTAKDMIYHSTGKTVVPLHEWHHVATTWDGRKVRVYLDGKLESEATVSAAFTVGPYRIYDLSVLD